MTDIITINSKGIVPNHLNDTNIFCRYANNSIIEVEPKEIHFAGYKLNEKNYQEIKFTNISDEICRFHIIPPVSKYFRLQYKKPERMVPGFFVTCTVIFSPDKVRNYNDFIKIHTKDSQNNIVVPVYAYPAIKGLSVPRNIKFPITAIGKSSKRQIFLHSDSEVDFDFEIVVTADNPSIKVDPLHGVIPAKGDTVIQLQFSPSAYVTCEKTINIYVNQYNFQPIICSLYGSSQPGLERKQILESIEQKDCETSNLLSIVKLESKRRTRPSHGSMPPASDKSLDRSTNLKAQRNYLKAVFDQKVLENTNNERQNQLRWQTCRGLRPLEDEEVEVIRQQREAASRDYKLLVREESSLFDCYLNKSVIKENWIKTINMSANDLDVPGEVQTPQFVPECWLVRRAALERFRSAVWRVITNCRLISRFNKLRQSGGVYQEVDLSHMHPGGTNLTFYRDLDGLSEERLPKEQVIFDNRFNMAEYKLTLPLQPRYDYEDLVVPLQMLTLAYERIDNTSLSYLPQRPAYTFRAPLVVDASCTVDEQSQVSPITFPNRCPSSEANETPDRTLLPFWPASSFYDRQSFLQLYHYKNDLLEPKELTELEWKTSKSAFLVSKKAVKSITSDKLIVKSLATSLLPLAEEAPGLMSMEDLAGLDYRQGETGTVTVTRAMMREEFPVLACLMGGRKGDVE